jgi:hypothetical protein
VPLLSLTEHRTHLRQWIKETSNRDVQDPLLDRWINQVYLEIASRASYHKPRVSFTLTSGQGAYTVDQIATLAGDSALRSKFMRPLRVLYDGEAIESKDFEELEDGGYLDPDATSGTPEVYSFESGDLELFPAPDAAAAAKKVTLLYAAYPGDLTEASPTFNSRFRPQWDEAVDWGVLEKFVSALSTEEQMKLPMSLQFISAKYAAMLESVRLDASYNPTRKYTLKSRGAADDATYFEDELGY